MAELYLPADWQESVVARHLRDPYSAEALAEPYTDTLDLGEVDYAQISEDGVIEYMLKAPGESPVIRDGQEDVEYLHRAFMDAAQVLVGGEMFDASSILFRREASPVEAYFIQKYLWGDPHMDGKKHPFFANQGETLRLNGMTCSALGTGSLHGPKRINDFDPENFEMYPNEAKKLREEILPPGHFYIAAPSLVHFSVRALQDIPMRHFMRWQLRA